MNIFGYIYIGYKRFVDIFWGHHKIGLYFGVISMHSRYRMGDILELLKFQILFGMLAFLIYFGGER